MIKQALTIAALAAVLATPAFAQSTKPMDNNTKSPAQNSMPNSMPSSMPSSTHGATNTPMNSTSASMQPAAFVQDQKSTDWRSSKLVGANVYGPDNAKIGDINDILIAQDGNVQAVVVGVGGFLGVGEKNVAIPFSALSVTRKADSATIDKVTVSYSKDELKNAPKFAWYQASAPQTTGAGTSVMDKLTPTKKK